MLSVPEFKHWVYFTEFKEMHRDNEKGLREEVMSVLTYGFPVSVPALNKMVTQNFIAVHPCVNEPSYPSASLALNEC